LPAAVLVEKLAPPEMVKIELDIDIAPPLPAAVLFEKLELPPKMVKLEPVIFKAPLVLLPKRLRVLSKRTIELDISIAVPFV
jgi:hypothetical protein